MTAGPNRSESLARQQILQYLTDTLQRLPFDIALSWQHPCYEHAIFGDALTVPAFDTVELGTPLLLNAEYWVVGVPAEQVSDYFQLILRIWEAFGWHVSVDQQAMPQRRARTRTPDDYNLTVVDNGKGDLAITASSPPFAREAVGGDPLPSTITHP
ncbi:hypothetical protein [Nocardia sp. NPDC049149]|uniref:hypothetical protein n=1 Tax=Nocardia sp. NPDC049149 TaxID=3364315 RepID=UPI003721EC12